MVSFHDGRYVAFTSYATNLVAGDTYGKWDILVKYTVTGEVTCSSSNANADSGWPVMSSDDNFVAFATNASNLWPVTPTRPEMFFWRRSKTRF
jgi:hypothetical protein